MVRIRKLAARDYRAVKKIERIIVDEYLAYLKETGEEDTIEPWITPEYFNHYVRAQASFVAEIARKLVGFILVQPTSFVDSAHREIWLEYIAVQPSSRRKGIGTMLMSSVTKYANTHDIPLLYTTMNPNNKESIQFLRTHGFEVKDWMKASKKLSH
jgi:ribosomal protein S18 acetylase RimI-like enzyme